MRHIFRILTLTVLLAFTGCGKDDREVKLETATSGEFEFIADEELRPAVDSLVAGFMRENKRAKITVRYASSGQAIEDLLNQKTRLVIVARPLSALENDLIRQNNLSLPEYDMAQNAIACVVSRSSGLNALSVTDLRAIVRNERKTWGDLQNSDLDGGALGAITKVIGPHHSSTEYVLDSMFLEPKAFQQGSIRRFTTTDSIIAYVRDDPNAIGFIGAAWLDKLQKAGDSSVRAVSLIPADTGQAEMRPVMLHLAYVHQGLYPLTSRVNGYTFDIPNTLPRGILAYAMTAHGQTVFKEHNILPRTQIIRIVPNR